MRWVIGLHFSSEVSLRLKEARCPTLWWGWKIFSDFSLAASFLWGLSSSLSFLFSFSPFLCKYHFNKERVEKQPWKSQLCWLCAKQSYKYNIDGKEWASTSCCWGKGQTPCKEMDCLEEEGELWFAATIKQKDVPVFWEEEARWKQSLLNINVSCKLEL